MTDPCDGCALKFAHLSFASIRSAMRALTFACLLGSVPAGAQTTFEPLGIPPLSGGLGSIPTDVSGSGAVIVGKIYDQLDGDEPRPSSSFRWERGEIEEITGCEYETLSVSDDGNTVAGACRTPTVEQDPAVWVNGVYQPVLLSGDFAGAYISRVAGNGLVLFGNMGVETEYLVNNVPYESTQAFRVAGGVPSVIGRLPGDLASYVVAVSRDGAAAAIESRLQGFEPGVPPEPVGDPIDASHGARFAAPAEGGQGSLQNLNASGEVGPTDISSDGTTIAGNSSSMGGFRWRAETGMQPLPLPLDALGVVPNAVSGDGKTVVGMYGTESFEIRAYLWTEADGARDLHDFVQVQLGVDLKGWTLRAATGISRDGLTIVGTGFAPGSSVPSGWRLGPPPSALEMTVEPSRIIIPEFRGNPDHEFRQEPALVTLYGRTVVPITVSVTDQNNGGGPVPNASVTFSVEGADVPVAPAHLGLGLEPEDDTSRPEELVVETDTDGLATVYLHTDQLYANAEEDDPNATGLTVSARYLDFVETYTIPVEDNRKRILDRYGVATDYFPTGAVDGFRNRFRDAFLPPLDRVDDMPRAALSALFAPGNTGPGSVLCNTYQSRSLVFLNDIRHSEDGWLVNGLDYSPLQTAHTDHHFVALYPHELPYGSARSRILDSWLPQRIAVYTWLEWVAFLDGGGHGSNIVPDARIDPDNPGACVVECGVGNFIPPPYPAAGGRYPYFPENASLPIGKRYDGCLKIPPAIDTTLPDGTVIKQIGWCQRNGFVGIERQLLELTATEHATVIVGSPVQFLVTMPDGRRFGFTGPNPDSYVNDFAGEFSTVFAELPEQSGGRGWYIEAPPGRKFRLDFPAIENGTMDVAVLGSGDRAWGGWLNVPITAGQTSGVDVDLDAACPAYSVPGSAAVGCEGSPACTNDAGCPSDDPCTPRVCAAGRCEDRPLDGLAAAACVCDRSLPADCAAATLPRPLLKTTGRACSILRSDGLSNERKRPKLLKRAVKTWKSATKLLNKRAIKRKLSDACRAAMSQRFADAGARVERARAVP
jgi:uncharacterized membrane protein